MQDLLKIVELSIQIYTKCHHNLIFEHFNFNVSLTPSYYRKIWGYKNVEINFTQNSCFSI